MQKEKLTPLDLTQYAGRARRLADDVAIHYGISSSAPEREAVRHFAHTLTRYRHAENLSHVVYLAFHLLHSISEDTLTKGQERSARREWQAAGMRGMSRKHDGPAVDELRANYERIKSRGELLERKKESVSELALLLVGRHVAKRQRNPGVAAAILAEQTAYADSPEWARDFELIYARLLRSLGEGDDWESQFSVISDQWSRQVPDSLRLELIELFAHTLAQTEARIAELEALLASGQEIEGGRGAAAAEIDHLKRRHALLGRERERIEHTPDLLDMEFRKLEALVRTGSALGLAEEGSGERSFELREQLDIAQRGKTQSEQEMLGLLKDKTELESELDRARSENERAAAALKADIETMQARLGSLAAEREKLEAERGLLKHECEALAEEKERLTSGGKALEGELEGMLKAQSELEAARESAEIAANTAAQTITQLTSSLGARTAELDSERRKRETSEALVTELTTATKRADERIPELERRLATRDTDTATAVARVDEAARTIEGLEITASDQATRIERLEHEAQDHARALAANQGELAALKAESAAHAGETKHAADELAHARAEATRVASEAQSLLAEKVVLETSLSEKAAQTGALQAQLVQVQAATAQRISELAAATDRLKTVESTLVEQTMRADGATNELKASVRKAAELQEAVDGMKRGYDSAMADARSARDEADALRRQLADALAQAGAAAREREKSNSELEHLLAEQTKLQGEAEKSVATIAELRAANDSFRQSAAGREQSLRTDRDRLAQELERLRDRIAKFDTERASLRERIEHAEEQKKLLLVALNRGDDDRKREQEDLAGQVDSLRQESGQRHQALLAAQLRLTELQQRTDAATERAIARDREATQLRRRLDEVESALADMADLRMHADLAQSDEDRTQIARQLSRRLDEVIRSGTPADGPARTGLLAPMQADASV